MTFFRSGAGVTVQMMKHFLPLVLLLVLPATCLASDYYFESLTYNIESSPRGTSYTCSLQFVSLRPDLKSVEVTIPYAFEEITSQLITFLGKTQVQPTMSDVDGGTHLTINFDGMKVGELETLSLRYGIDEGTGVSAGARVEVRTFGLEADVTTHALNLKLPRGFTVSRIETPDGVLRSGRSGIPLDLGRESLVLYFVIRRLTILDNSYVTLGLSLGVIAVVVGGVLYFLYRRKLIFKGNGDKSPIGDGRSEPTSHRD
jgi:hypothetical protein